MKRIFFYSLLVLNLIFTNYPLWAQTVESFVIDLHSNRELFIDHYLIDQMIGTRLVMHHPINEGPVLQFDKLWEGPFCSYCTVIKEGEELFINFPTSAAIEIKVEVQDKDRTVIPDFSAEDCQIIIGNEISKRVSWGKGKNLSDLEGKGIRLLFLMKDADLYALKFE